MLPDGDISALPALAKLKANKECDVWAKAETPSGNE
jgi:hypothetical protein